MAACTRWIATERDDVYVAVDAAEQTHHGTFPRVLHDLVGVVLPRPTVRAVSRHERFTRSTYSIRLVSGPSCVRRPARRGARPRSLEEARALADQLLGSRAPTSHGAHATQHHSRCTRPYVQDTLAPPRTENGSTSARTLHDPSDEEGLRLLQITDDILAECLRDIGGFRRAVHHNVESGHMLRKLQHARQRTARTLTVEQAEVELQRTGRQTARAGRPGYLPRNRRSGTSGKTRGHYRKEHRRFHHRFHECDRENGRQRRSAVDQVLHGARCFCAAIASSAIAWYPKRGPRLAEKRRVLDRPRRTVIAAPHGGAARGRRYKVLSAMPPSPAPVPGQRATTRLQTPRTSGSHEAQAAVVSARESEAKRTALAVTHLYLAETQHRGRRVSDSVGARRCQFRGWPRSSSRYCSVTLATCREIRSPIPPWRACCEKAKSATSSSRSPSCSPPPRSPG
jgi:hypothetical protein